MARRHLAATILLALLPAGCAPAGFASHEADLMREPPPSLPSASTAYWNDTANGTYGAITVAPRTYRYRDAPCRTARITAIAASGAQQDRMVLYCALAGIDGPDRRFVLDPSLACRAAPGDAIACRGADGDVIVLPPS